MAASSGRYTLDWIYSLLLGGCYLAGIRETAQLSREVSSCHLLPDAFASVGESVETVFLLFFRNTKFDQLPITKLTNCS